MYSTGTNLVRYRITSGGYALKIGDIVSYIRDVDHPTFIEVKILKCSNKQLVNENAYVTKNDFIPMPLLKRKTDVI